MSKQEQKRNDREGDIFPQMVGWNAKGELVWHGGDAPLPKMEKRDGQILIYAEDGFTVKATMPDPEFETDDEWFQAFKDPEEGDIEVSEVKHVATGELYKG